MKKNKMMRTASGLLVATLLTTSVISGTFAKYTTEDSGSDTARVAKWGITVSTSGNLFGKEYANNTAQSGADSIVASAQDSTTVKATDKNVVAPGTKNEEGFTVAIAGTPEVAYNVTAESSNVDDIFLGAGDWGVMVEATGLNAASKVDGLYTLTDNTYSKATGQWISGTKYYKLMNHVEVDADYYPIKWTVKTEAGTTRLSDITDTKNLKTIANSIKNNLSVSNANPGTTSDASYNLTWIWPYESKDDGADTILGNLHDDFTGGTVVYAQDTSSSEGTKEASYTTPTKDKYNLDINFNLKVTVTQVD